MKRIKLKKYNELKKSTNAITQGIKNSGIDTPINIQRETLGNIRETPKHNGGHHKHTESKNERSPVRVIDNKFMEITKDKFDRFNIRHFQVVIVLFFLARSRQTLHCCLKNFLMGNGGTFGFNLKLNPSPELAMVLTRGTPRRGKLALAQTHPLTRQPRSGKTFSPSKGRTTKGSLLALTT